MKLYVLLIAACLCFVARIGAQTKEKSIIEYLGTTYIMPDGCPTPDCDAQDPECIRTKR